MKPFNIDEYLKNPSRRVVTRDCKEVRIICIDRLDEDYPIIALVKVLTNVEWCESFTADGRNSKVHKESDFDLFFAPEKHEKWINIYRETTEVSSGAVLYDSREEAEDVGKSYTHYVATAKVEWKE